MTDPSPKVEFEQGFEFGLGWIIAGVVFGLILYYAFRVKSPYFPFERVDFEVMQKVNRRLTVVD